MENIDTFEYPPLAITFSEDESNNSNVDDDDDDEFEQMARINAEFTASKLPEKSFEPKGTKDALICYCCCCSLLTDYHNLNRFSSRVSFSHQ